jgi:phthalate 4,5-cis-dihydrodiol dehydrogenase
MMEPLRLGIAGLSRAFVLMLPTLTRHPGIRIVAAADTRREARDAFSRDFSARTYESVDALCADADVEAVYIATPHQFHSEHAAAACRHGKHILVEKPMALSLDECERMARYAEEAGVHLIVGHSHSFDTPYAKTAELISSGRFGALRMISAVNFTDFLYRPRRPEELDTAQGGGVVFSQAAHQIDIVRLLAGGDVASVFAQAGNWDSSRPTEGAYQALLTFKSGVSASLTYSGYAHFDTDEFLDWTGEMGQRRNPDEYGIARRALRNAADPEREGMLKNDRAYGSSKLRSSQNVGALHNHFGFVIASCEKADLRPMANGVMIYTDEQRYLDPLPAPAVPRAEVIDELIEAVRYNRAPFHSGRWGLATLEVCLGILESTRLGAAIPMRHQPAKPVFQHKS